MEISVQYHSSTGSSNSHSSSRRGGAGSGGGGGGGGGSKAAAGAAAAEAVVVMVVMECVYIFIYIYIEREREGERECQGLAVVGFRIDGCAADDGDTRSSMYQNRARLVDRNHRSCTQRQQEKQQNPERDSVARSDIAFCALHPA